MSEPQLRIGAGVPAKKSTRGLWIALGLVVALALALAGVVVALMVMRASVPVAAAPTSPYPVETVSTTAKDPAGQQACRLVKEAYDADRLMDVATVEAILKAAQGSVTFEVQFDGQMLKDRQGLAIGSKGTSREVSRTLELQTQALRMQTRCISAGLA